MLLEKGTINMKMLWKTKEEKKEENYTDIILILLLCVPLLWGNLMSYAQVVENAMYFKWGLANVFFILVVGGILWGHKHLQKKK